MILKLRRGGVAKIIGTIRIRNRDVPVDVRAEIADFPWIRPRWTADKLIAASPMRYDYHPSFFVNLDPHSPYYGCWADSGAIDPEWRSGGFVKLLAFLRGETYEETAEYLIAKYALGEQDAQTEPTISIPVLSVNIQRDRQTLNISMLDEYKFRSPYLGRRMISEDVQRMMRIGYDRDRRAVTIPFFNPDGTLGNILFRKINEKTFWYAKGGQPVREMVYGINIVYQRKVKRAVIVEAPIDALTIMSAGICAIAVGGTAFNEYKRDLIVRSPLEEIIIMADHDAPGQVLKRKIIAMLAPYMRVKVAGYPIRWKDPNEMAVAYGSPMVIRKYVDSAKGVKVKISKKILLQV